MNLGKTYQDTITGFTGVCIGKCEYISGCNQVLLQPKGEKSDVRPASEWFDVQRLEELPGDAIVLNNDATPGCDREAPRR